MEAKQNQRPKTSEFLDVASLGYAYESLTEGAGTPVVLPVPLQVTGPEPRVLAASVHHSSYDLSLQGPTEVPLGGVTVAITPSTPLTAELAAEPSAPRPTFERVTLSTS
ncbi:hypothetical protein T261_1344 [Streptomyces lydicus]|nr:hypothetical protein T261_1344 [Streptomyces lydicus]